MIKAVIFDFFGVLEQSGRSNKLLFTYIKVELKPKYKIGIISNSSGRWLTEMMTKDERELFDDVVTSHKFGLAKPEAGIYEAALDNLGIKASEAVFIDDTEDYCMAARAVGMPAIRYDNFEQMKFELEKLL